MSGILLGIGIALVILLILIVGTIVLVFARASRKHESAVEGNPSPSDELQVIPLPELERRASAALVRTDDALQASAQELGFAQAQYGERAALPFAESVDAAKSRLIEAFLLKQKLDDEVPDTEQERREWNSQIIRLSADASSLLQEQADAFAELRSLEKDIPEKVATLRSEIAAVQHRETKSDATLAELGSTYTDSALTTVRDNGVQATERLTFASTSLADAEAKAATRSMSDAAVGVRAAEAAIGQAKLLLDAVDRVSADLATARGTIDALVSELQRDIADARVLAAGGDPSGAIMAAERSTVDAVSEVQARLISGNVDPRELIRKLELANRDIDGVLGAARTRQVQEQRASASLGQAIASAQAEVSAADDFIAARRGAVGAEARTRLTEATRLLKLAQGISATDTIAALSHAQRAGDLAAQSIQLAEHDVNGFASTTGSGGLFGLPGQTMGGGRGGGRGVGAGGILGAVLGGILIDSVLRGGDHDGLFGGGDDNRGDDFFSGGFGGGDGGGFFGGDGGGDGGGF
ncbi:MAG TPA: hypothetical protein VGO31_04910 [Microbacteriaceae bacterium]|jgi:hypothetical protein|nr:hypothetical protein [Microbacteriaceae bacterium]